MKRRAGEAAMVERSANTICCMGMRISILFATEHFHYLLHKLFIHLSCHVRTTCLYTTFIAIFVGEFSMKFIHRITVTRN